MGAISSEELEHILALQRLDGRMVGEILIDRGLVSPLALAAALSQQKRQIGIAKVPAPARPPSWRPLGRLLVDRRCITEVQLRQALADQQDDGGFLGEILTERGWITPAELVGALAVQLSPVGERGNRFHVREHLSGEVKTLHACTNFIDASDYVFEQVLADREPERLEIVRGSGPGAEVVWSYQRVERRQPSGVDLLKILSSLVGEWAVAPPSASP
jgi:hypothetical protein